MGWCLHLHIFGPQIWAACVYSATDTADLLILSNASKCLIESAVRASHFVKGFGYFCSKRQTQSITPVFERIFKQELRLDFLRASARINIFNALMRIRCYDKLRSINSLRFRTKTGWRVKSVVFFFFVCFCNVYLRMDMNLDKKKGWVCYFSLLFYFIVSSPIFCSIYLLWSYFIKCATK